MLKILPSLAGEPAALPFLQTIEPLAAPCEHAGLQRILEQRGQWCLYAPHGQWQWLANLEKLNFDSQLFGYQMARLQPLMHYPARPDRQSVAGGRAFFKALRTEALNQGLQFLMARVNSRDILAAQSLEEAGFRLTDVSVELELELRGLPALPESPEYAVEPWREDDRLGLVELAGSAFSDLNAYADRFTQDFRLRPYSGKLYETWLNNCFAGSQADQVLVLKKGPEAGGFIALRLPGQGGGQAWIVLNALRPSLRGQGLYNFLLLAGLRWLEAHGANRARVRTKLSQQAVIQAWSRLGGRQAGADMTFHWWHEAS